MITRLMTKEDIPSVLQISNSCFKGNESWDTASFVAEMSNHLAHCLVIEDNSEILGFANVWIIAREANINSIATHENYRGKGIGTALLLGILNYCKENNTNEITLEVRESNLAAQNFYKKCGFIVEGERKKYYSNNGESAILMGNRNIIKTLDN